MISRRGGRARRNGAKPSARRVGGASAKRARARRATVTSKRKVASSRPSLQRRRARALLFGSGVFAIVVLATSMPVSALLSQHKQLSSSTRQVGTLEAQNKALEQEAQQLSDPSTVAGIARRDYGLVAPGSQAYEILPASGSSMLSAQGSGHVPLEAPPVAPGSARSQELLAAGTDQGAGAGGGAVSAATSSAGSARSGRSAIAGGRRATGRSARSGMASGGFWTRVVGTLEFWR